MFTHWRVLTFAFDLQLLKVVTVVSTHCTYLWRDGQAELNIGWSRLCTKIDFLNTATHPRTNRARRRTTSLTGLLILPLNKAVTHSAAASAWRSCDLKNWSLVTFFSQNNNFLLSFSFLASVLFFRVTRTDRQTNAMQWIMRSTC